MKVFIYCKIVDRRYKMFELMTSRHELSEIKKGCYKTYRPNFGLNTCIKQVKLSIYIINF